MRPLKQRSEWFSSSPNHDQVAFYAPIAVIHQAIVELRLLVGHGVRQLMMVAVTVRSFSDSGDCANLLSRQAVRRLNFDPMPPRSRRRGRLWGGLDPRRQRRCRSPWPWVSRRAARPWPRGPVRMNLSGPDHRPDHRRGVLALAVLLADVREVGDHHVTVREVR